MTDSHLSPEAISRIATGRISGADRAAAVSHLESCATCRDDVTYLIGFVRRQRRRRLAWIGGTAVAAVLVVSVFPTTGDVPGGTGSTFREQTRPAPAVRVGDEGVPYIASYTPGNGAGLEGDSAFFAWQDMGPDTHYRLHVSGASGAPVLDRAVRDTAVYLPLVSPLEVGKSYFWFVDALLEDGGAARSNVWRFTLLE